MIELQFSTTRHLTSKAIAYGTFSWASHVDFVLPDGRLLGAISKGVCIHEPYGPDVMTKSERYFVDAPDSVIDIALEEIGKPYDWQGIFNFFVRNRNWEETDAWFCSELAAYAFKKAGVPLIRAETYRVTPGNLLMSPFLIPCEGK
jgi:hypothetical protein